MGQPKYFPLNGVREREICKLFLNCYSFKSKSYLILFQQIKLKPVLKKTHYLQFNENLRMRKGLVSG